MNKNKTISFEVYKDFAEVADLQGQWDDFVESMGGEVSQTYDWCRLWWKYYGKGRKLRIFIFRSEGRLVAIVPIFYERLFLGPVFINTIKLLTSDFGINTASMSIEREFAREVLEGIFVQLKKEFDFDVVYLGPLSELYTNVEELVDTCNSCGSGNFGVYVTNKKDQTYYKIPVTWDDYLMSLNKKVRGDVRRNYKIISEMGAKDTVSVESRFAEADDLEDRFDEFIEMHRLRWEQTGKSGHFADWPLAYEFHKELAKAQLSRGRLRLLKVSQDGQGLAFEYCYKLGDRYLQFMNARSIADEFSQIGLGKISFCELIKRAVSENITCIDSMQGNYGHKLRMGGKLLPVRNIMVYPDRLTTRIRIFIFQKFARFLRIFYYRLWFSRIVPALPFRRKTVWKFYIKNSVFAR